MEHYCITGGIGAGKSYVCQLLRKYGIDIYDCDEGAKHITKTSEEVKAKLTALMGDEVYLPDGTYNKPVVVKYLLASEENKQALNAVIHPAVMQDFYDSGLQWMESAILYEAHLDHWVDKVVAVTAPQEVRIRRVMQRDRLDYDKAKAWVDRQADQNEVARRADYVIVNDGETEIEEQIKQLLQTINK